MGNMQTRVYRNDGTTDYNIPGLGIVLAGQRISFQGEFPPAINLQNYPDLVDVLDEEENGKGRNYDKEPEVTDAAAAGGDLTAAKGDSDNG